MEKLKGCTFDLVLIVLKTTDYRESIQEVTLMKTMNKFIDNIEPSRVFLVFTHCDRDKPVRDVIKGKLAMFQKYCGLKIPEANRILFGNKKENLLPLFEFRPNLGQKVMKLSKNI